MTTKTTKTAAATIEATVKQTAETVKQTAETVKAHIEAGQQAAAKNFEQAIAQTQDKIAQFNQTTIKNVDDLAALGKDNVEALVQSSTILAKGFEQMTRAFVNLTQATLEQQMKVGKAMLTAKNLKELTELHSDFARTSVDTLMSEASKLSEISIQVANEAFQPLSARMTATVEAITKTAA